MKKDPVFAKFLDIAVLDYSVGEVHIYRIPEDADVAEFLKRKGHKPSECNYMMNEHIKIQTH